MTISKRNVDYQKIRLSDHAIETHKISSLSGFNSFASRIVPSWYTAAFAMLGFEEWTLHTISTTTVSWLYYNNKIVWLVRSLILWLNID